LILVSACLLGVSCRYDGQSKFDAELADYLRTRGAVPVCPEQLGGLSTPRPPAQIKDGDGLDVLDGNALVITLDGRDETRAFLNGAIQTLHIANVLGINECILKAKSPSCGLTPRIGVTAALLIKNGLHISERP